MVIGHMSSLGRPGDNGAISVKNDESTMKSGGTTYECCGILKR